MLYLLWYQLDTGPGQKGAGLMTETELDAETKRDFSKLLLEDKLKIIRLFYVVVKAQAWPFFALQSQSEATEQAPCQ